jgi:hypothetical protein
MLNEEQVRLLSALKERMRVLNTENLIIREVVDTLTEKRGNKFSPATTALKTTYAEKLILGEMQLNDFITALFTNAFYFVRHDAITKTDYIVELKLKHSLSAGTVIGNQLLTVIETSTPLKVLDAPIETKQKVAGMYFLSFINRAVVSHVDTPSCIAHYNDQEFTDSLTKKVK